MSIEARYIAATVACLLIALIYLFIYPGRNDPAKSRPRLRHIVLRWFHALVWMLLAMSSLMFGRVIPGGSFTGRVVALAALVLYLIFILNFLLDRKAQKKEA
jgi:uncharacterized membrane-anchored protein